MSGSDLYFLTKFSNYSGVFQKVLKHISNDQKTHPKLNSNLLLQGLATHKKILQLAIKNLPILGSVRLSCSG